VSTIESQCSREAALFHKNCLICSFLLVTPRPNSAAAAEGGNISQGDGVLCTSDVIIMTPLL